MNYTDPIWRLNNLYKIKTKQSKIVTFNQNNVQKYLNHPAKRKIVLKARQFGISTGELLRMFDATIFNRNFVACILAHEQDGIKKLFEIPKRAYENLPPELQPELGRGGGSKYAMEYPKIGSKIYADLSSRGDTINWLHVSEMAFIKDPERVFATMEAVPLDGMITWESTPNGVGGEFYEKWQEPGNFHKFFFPWYIFHEYQLPCSDNLVLTQDEIKLKQYALKAHGIDLTNEQIEFRRVKQQDLKHLFIQEYPEDPESCFLSSGDAIFDLVYIRELIESCRKPIFQDDYVKIFKEFRSDNKYVIGCDTAEGIDGDYSVAQVFSLPNFEQVAVVRGHLKPSDFAHKIKEIADKYTHKTGRTPKISVERNNHGHAVILELKEHIKYPNLYVHKDGKDGWLTDRVTRPVMINAFIDAIENNTVKFNDKITLGECMTLVNNKGKIEAAEGKHDDCVTSSCIAIQLLLEAKKLDIYDNISSKILL